MTHIAIRHVAAAALVALLPSLAEAGPPLICNPFHTSGAPLLAWGSGPGWNTPDRSYDVRRLTTDVLALLTDEAPVLSRMENMRRAVIYATRERGVAEQLLAAVLARAAAPNASRLAVFDAGYLIESYKQAAHLFGRQVTSDDGYAMVRRAIAMGRPAAEMEFAAALMTEGAAWSTHLRRLRSGSDVDPLLARNLAAIGW